MENQQENIPNTGYQQQAMPPNMAYQQQAMPSNMDYQQVNGATFDQQQPMPNAEYQQEQLPVPDNTVAADAEPSGKFLSFDPMSASQKCKAKCSICLLYVLVLTLGIASAILREIRQRDKKSTVELPNFSSEQYDWNQFIFSSIYTVDADKGCQLNDEPIFKMVYPGVQETCYAQVIGFDEARDQKENGNTTQVPKTYLYGSCRVNDYGSQKRCKSSGKNRVCRDVSDVRKYSTISGTPPMNITSFSGKKYCGKALQGGDGEKSIYKSLMPIKASQTCDQLNKSQKSKWVECPSSNGGKVCAPGDKCPINSISAFSFGTADKNEQVIQVGTQKLYLSSVQAKAVVTQVSIQLGQPCVNFRQLANTTSDIYQFFEKSSGCEIDEKSKNQSANPVDKKFIKLIELDENLYDLYDTSGVLAVERKQVKFDQIIQNNLKNVKPFLYFKQASTLKSTCPIDISEVNQIESVMKSTWQNTLTGWDAASSPIFTQSFLPFILVPFFCVFCCAFTSKVPFIKVLFMVIVYLIYIYQLFKFLGNLGGLSEAITRIETWNENANKGVKNLQLCVDAQNVSIDPQYYADYYSSRSTSAQLYRLFGIFCQLFALVMVIVITLYFKKASMLTWDFPKTPEDLVREKEEAKAKEAIEMEQTTGQQQVQGGPVINYGQPAQPGAYVQGQPGAYVQGQPGTYAQGQPGTYAQGQPGTNGQTQLVYQQAGQNYGIQNDSAQKMMDPNVNLNYTNSPPVQANQQYLPHENYKQNQ